MPAVLEVDHLAKSFGNTHAVDDVSFSIEAGEIFSLLGPNGAGKTTTISMLSTLIKPTRGDARVHGYSVVREPMEVRKTIGVVPQEIALYDMLSGRENLGYWGQMYGLGGSTLKRRVETVLDQVGLSEKASQKVKTYSGGMKRRLNIAVGLLHIPRILFMDEPTVGIDPQSRRNILDVILALNQQGMTIFYTTHNMEEAEELSDRVGIIDHGQLIALGTQAELNHLVGENETIHITLGEDQDAHAVAHRLKSIPGLIDASAVDHEVLLIVPNAEETLAPAITQINAIGSKIQSVEVQEPNLEAVFLHLTGRALRD